MNKMILIIGIVLLIITSVVAYKTVYNPFTRKLDYVGAVGQGVFYNITATTHSGSFTNGSYVGYEAGNAICSAEYSGTHMCTQMEIIATIAYTNISAMSDWTSNGWASTGSAKYAPASIPVNDCNGWQNESSSDFLGTFWFFDTGGGKGGVINCGSTKKISCCS